MKNLKIGEKITRFPLIQGGMGVGISLGRLAGSVAAEGGVGIISTAQIGYREADFDRDPAGANLRAIESEMKKAREISPDGIVGYNVMTALKEHAAHVKAAVKAGADIIISGAGLPTELPELVAGSRTKIAPVVSTERSVNVILKYWDRKYRRTADLVVVEGPQAGGHLGFKKEELGEYTEAVYAEEIKKILAAVRKYAEKYQTEIPVVVAGGDAVCHHRGVRRGYPLQGSLHPCFKRRYSDRKESGRNAGTGHHEPFHAACYGRGADPPQPLPPLSCKMQPGRYPILYHRRADRSGKREYREGTSVLRGKGIPRRADRDGQGSYAGAVRIGLLSERKEKPDGCT